MALLDNTPQPSFRRLESSWSWTRLQNAVNSSGRRVTANRDGVHYEASLYGPLNNVFNMIFPADRMFMVKLQGLLHGEYNAQISSAPGTYSDSDFSHILGFNEFSAGIGEEFPTWPGNWEEDEGTAAGNEEGIAAGNDEQEEEEEVGSKEKEKDANDGDSEEETEKDSVVLKDTAAPLGSGLEHLAGAISPNRFPEDYDANGGNTTQDSFGDIVAGALMKNTYGNVDFVVVKATESLTDDIILAIIEVKVNDSRIDEHSNQVNDYMNFAKSKNRLPNLRGYLVAGNRVHVWQFSGWGASSSHRQLKGVDLTIEQFVKELHDLAGTQWNVTA